MISISPYNFYFVKISFFVQKGIRGYVYLRSDGYLEYKYRYGFLGYFLSYNV